MDGILLTLVTAAAGLIIGILVTSTILRKAVEKKSESVLKEAQEKAEVIKKEKILQAKEKFLQLKSEHERIIQDKNNILNKNENRLKQKESTFSQRMEELQRKQKEINTIKNNLSIQLDLVNKKQVDLEKSHRKQVEQLETISGLSAIKIILTNEQFVHSKDTWINKNIV